MRLLIFVILQLCITFVYSNSKLTCNSHKSCGECISFAGDSCVWCIEVPSKTDSHCVSASEISNGKGCEKEYRVLPKNTYKLKFGSDPNLLRGGINPIQFVPHQLDITTRPGLVVEFDMYYKPAKDYPIDVYFLMDHSYTMKNYTKDLFEQGNLTYTTLTNLVNNVRFGVGTFIEKPALPYADPNKHVAYSFKNYLNLTDDINKFTPILENVTFGANYEDPEAGLDALMQVMKCEKELNWREGARRIIVYCTDATYHSAGDGKMLGIDTPNDMQCHLTNDKYDGDLIYDYPSVSQIRKVATDGKFIIIFAATKKVQTDYTELAREVKNGAKYAPLQLEKTASGELKSNIVQIIKDTYQESISYVKISGSNWPSNVELMLEQDKDSREHNEYKIGPTETLHVKAKLRVKNCEGDKNQVLNIGTSSLREGLTINLNVDCECDCEKGPLEINSVKCNTNGTRQCGVCICNEGRSGHSCECSMDTVSHSVSNKACKANETDTQFCNSRGACSCGICQCNGGFSGTFCEYDDKACVRVDKQLCAGHGTCHLGKCNCKGDWEGPDCNCPLDVLPCTDPYSKKVCSGNGDCVCGVCVCAKENAKISSYGADFCDGCGPECAKRRCQVLEELVECHFFHNTTCDYSQDTVVHTANRTEINSAKWGGERCEKAITGDDRWIVFKHYFNRDDRKIHVVVQDQLEDPPKADIWVPVGIAIGTVLLIGLLTVVIWKILVDHYDAKEYEKFAREAKEAGFEVTNNPFYVNPRIEITNPAFQQ